MGPGLTTACRELQSGENDDFSDDMSCVVVVLVDIGMISGQSEKQSTVMRYCCPACVQKSAAIS